MPAELPLFSFASPPRTGVVWFLEACRSAGLGGVEKKDAFAKFSQMNDRSKLRVSLVRHPCQWLASIYATLTETPPSCDCAVHAIGTAFVGLDKSSFDAFVRSYLQAFPQGMSALFDEYKADTRMRLEDMPWALLELLESFDVPESMMRRAERIQRMNWSVDLPKWNTVLHRQVMDAERAFCEVHDYY